ncbi:MAG: hypothetical protein NTW11_00370 [Candidatus Staskawiczbacteria bacterium]|nr:hypothetical protein [Candidatus Staskawiczbacteria bacterium]
MIIESIALVIFICSFGGAALILIKKMPALHALPYNGNAGIREHKFVLNIENRVKAVLVFFEKQIFLHKFLSWVKVMILKVERNIDVLLHKIRKKAQQDKEIKDKK